MSESIALTPNEQQPHVDPVVVNRVREMCMALSGTVEKEAWGDPSFRVNGRMYAILKFGFERTNLWLAAPDGAQETLVATDPTRFFHPSAHPLHAGWIGVRLDMPPAVDWDEVEFLLAQAHELIGSKATSGRKRTTR